MADLYDIALTQRYSQPMWVVETTGPVPFACPVCSGCGLVPHGFYSGVSHATSTTPETCRACKGQGIVWREET